jgi:high-affinity nickel permease
VVTFGAAALLLGTLSGFRHAFEPDHLAAVSTLVAERPDPVRAARLGAWWGLGHTLALAGVGAVLAVADQALPAPMQEAFELVVAVILLALGLRAMRLSLRQMDDSRAGASRAQLGVHRHSGLPAHVHIGRQTLALRPLTIGLVHGLAGSGALTALVMSSLQTTPLRLTYLILFGVASTVGMVLVSGLAGFSLVRFARSNRAHVVTSFVTGTLSVALAVLWGFPILAGWLA